MDEGSAAALSSMLNSAAQNISSAGYGIAGAQMSKADRKAQERWMKMQRQWALEDWNRNVDYQRELWKQSTDYDASEWERRFNLTNRYNEQYYRDYNSPAAQMRAMRQAGINPFYALSQIQGASMQAGTAPAPGVSQGSAPGVNGNYTLPPNRQLFQPNFGSDPASFMDALIQSEQFNLLQENTKSKRLENLLDLGSLAGKLESQRYQNQEQAKRQPYIENFIESELRQANAQENNTIANTALAYQSLNTMIEETTMKKQQLEMAKELQAFSMQQQLKMDEATINQIAHTISMLDAQAGMFGAQSGLLKAQTGTEYVNTLWSALRAQGVDLDNRQKVKLLPYVIDHAKQQKQADRWSNKQASQQEWYLRKQKYNPFYWFGAALGGTGAAAIKTFAK